METKNQDETVLRCFANTPYCYHFTVPPVGLSGGLVLSWKEHVNVNILDSSPNYIDIQVTTGAAPTFITFVYGAPRMENRALLWKKLSTLGIAREDAWLITGDFNDLLDNSEKEGGLMRWEGSFVAFRSFVTQSGLWDLQHTGNQLSWRGTRYNHFIQARLDRAMVNCGWSEIFPTSYCEYLSFEGSDHRPLMTYLDNKKKKHLNLFRYDRRLTTKPEVNELVQDNWKGCYRDSVLTRLCRVRLAIIKWTRECNCNSKEAIQSAQRNLEEALSSNSPDTDLIGMLTTELNRAYEEEERYWQQRSRILWLQHGDRNSSYFHAITRGRTAVNKFSVLEQQDGTVVYEEDQIVATVAEYYNVLFTSASSDSAPIVEEAIAPCISENMNITLISIPSDAEIKEAVYTIHGDKAPGPDGFLANFYQGFWDIIGGEVCREIRAFFCLGTAP